ncbi:MAG: PCRF domain-containing protein [Patescibacteria group bacterium]
MSEGDFWANKEKAQATIKEIQRLKEEAEGVGKFDRGDAILTIYSGAGGDDAEDFTAMLYRMYMKYTQNKGWGMSVIDSASNNLGGYRNITVEISGAKIDGRGPYGILKNESGVHRLVRQSPFNSKGLRQTSFSLVEVIPKFEKAQSADFDLPDKDIEISIAKSGGPGGQNVNKRETAVRIVHIPTKLSVHVTSERSQAQNKEKAIEILKAKIYKTMEDERKAKEKGLYISKTTSIDWGNQIRSYVLHPYKMIKDHRTDVETAKVDSVLEGDIDEFIEAEKDL